MAYLDEDGDRERGKSSRACANVRKGCVASDVFDDLRRIKLLEEFLHRLEANGANLELRHSSYEDAKAHSGVEQLVPISVSSY